MRGFSAFNFSPSGFGGGGGVPAGQILSNVLGADVNLSNITNYFDGPTITLGAGTWYVEGSVALMDSAAANFYVKIWDGTTNFSSAISRYTAGGGISVTTSAIVINPAGPVRLAARDPTTVNGVMKANLTGLGLDSYILGFRLR